MRIQVAPSRRFFNFGLVLEIMTLRRPFLTNFEPLENALFPPVSQVREQNSKIASIAQFVWSRAIGRHPIWYNCMSGVGCTVTPLSSMEYISSECALTKYCFQAQFAFSQNNLSRHYILIFFIFRPDAIWFWETIFHGQIWTDCIVV